MLKVNKIEDGLTKLIEDARNVSTSGLFLFGNSTNISKSLSSFVDDCLALHDQLRGKTDDDSTSSETRDLISLERRFWRLRARLFAIPATLVIYALFSASLLLLKYVNLANFVKDVLKVDAPERLITFGVAGALLYLATTVLERLEDRVRQGHLGLWLTDIAVRFLLAIVVPIVLVALLFTSDGHVGDVKLTPELLAFACGYSAKLVVQLLNKIVQKGTKMIEVI